MPQVIAGLYELGQEIGAGGGGVVYLGRHMRLDKPVVLKADKRTLSIGEKDLRREVDLLKELRHTNIPQVYDFIQEDGIVYTVMDYIEGESLDKLIAEGRLPRQAELIGWACQLLEALIYLHSRPPYGILHGDIKPANIMKRPDGTVCLIDFNIALALGEDGAVKVGFSRGYASPEHYGAYYPQSCQTAEKKKKELQRETEMTVLLGEEKTELLKEGTTEVLSDMAHKPPVSRSSAGSTSGGKGTLLDVRSDIYSLGATLYHLISGIKPPQDAGEVKPLGKEICSENLAVILRKAMAPRPEDRYQTAQEMLEAFCQLHRRDVRSVRHRRHMAIAAGVVIGIFLTGGACTFIGMSQMEQRQSALVLAEYSANALREGDTTTAVRQAMRAIPSPRTIWDAPVTAQAQKALTDALGVYNLSDGFQALDSVELPGAPFTVAASPGGSRLAVIYGYELAVYDMETCQKITVLPVEQSALDDVVFVNESLVLYAGQEGVTAYDLDRQSIQWIGETATNLTLSADGTVAACVNRDTEYALVYRVADGLEVCKCEFGENQLSVPANDIFADAEDDIFALNADGTLLAVSSSYGGITLYNLQNGDDSLILYETSDYTAFAGGFHGKYFAYTAGGNGRYEFGLVDTEAAAWVGNFDSQDPFLLQADEKGIYLANGNVLVEFDAETLQQKERAYTDAVNIRKFSADEEYALVATEDDCFAFYDRGANRVSVESFDESCDFTVLQNGYAALGNRDKPVLRLLKMENHADARLFAYDPEYTHDEARISHDKQTAMLFSYQGFRVYTMDGRTVAEVELPDAERIYDQQFYKNDAESYLEVIWYDGTRRRYSARDGSITSETKGEIPDRSLTEEFITEDYLIVSKLHEAPVVYDLKSGKEIKTLETNAYLTYVTRVDDYIITEYLMTDEGGKRYGLLLDNRLETLAVLPDLCDVSDGELIFDCRSGELRRSPLYSLQELITLGEAY